MSTPTEPVIRKSTRGRTMTADWTVKTDRDGHDGAERKHIACLTVSYDEGGVNYFQGTVNNPRCYRATLAIEIEEAQPGGYYTRSYVMFDRKRILILRSEPVARFNAKRFARFFDEALEELARKRAGDRQVAAFFE